MVKTVYPSFVEINNKEYPVVDRDLYIKDPESLGYNCFKQDVVYFWRRYKKAGEFCGFIPIEESGVFYSCDIYFSDLKYSLRGDGQLKEDGKNLIESALFDLQVNAYILSTKENNSSKRN